MVSRTLLGLMVFCGLSVSAFAGELDGSWKMVSLTCGNGTAPTLPDYLPSDYMQNSLIVITGNQLTYTFPILAEGQRCEAKTVANFSTASTGGKNIITTTLVMMSVCGSAIQPDGSSSQEEYSLSGNLFTMMDTTDLETCGGAAVIHAYQKQ